VNFGLLRGDLFADDEVEDLREALIVCPDVLLKLARSIRPVVVVLKGDAVVEVDGVVAVRVGREDVLVGRANGVGLVNAKTRVFAKVSRRHDTCHREVRVELESQKSKQAFAQAFAGSAKRCGFPAKPLRVKER